MNSDKKNRAIALKGVLSRLKKYTAWIILSVVLAAATVVMSLYIPILIGRAIDYIIEPPAAIDFTAIAIILIKVGMLAGATALLQWVMNTINNKVTYQVIEDVRSEAIRKLQKLPLSYLDSHSSGDIVSRVIADADQFADGLLLGFTQLFTGVVTIMCTLIFMLIINPGVALLVVVLTPLSLIMARFIASRTYKMFREQSQTRGEQTAFTDEIITNQKVVKAFSREEKSTESFDEINGRLQKASLRATFFSSLTNPCTRFINSLIYAAVALSGALLVIGGGLTVGNLTCLLSYANQYTKPFNEISGVITELQNALACASRLFELTDDAPRIADSPNAKALENVHGNVSLDNVSFSYAPEQRLIEGLNLTVKPGQRIAIVGPTGCGKTTLINLLMRFYDVTGGAVRVEDIDIRELTRHSLRKGYGMVLQDTWLKEGTVRENIAMGMPDASDEQIINAAKASHAHSFIKRLPQGYDTSLSEDGGALSQGQRQLLCIARVMLCLPPMLILDEATSSIDTRTELKIQDAFAQLMKGRTCFIVAHRLSTIRDADVILVMKDGKIIEQGNHEQLIEKNGFYSVLYNSQFAQ